MRLKSLHNRQLQRYGQAFVGRGANVKAKAKMRAAAWEVGPGKARVLANLAREQAVTTG